MGARPESTARRVTTLRNESTARRVTTLRSFTVMITVMIRLPAPAHADLSPPPNSEQRRRCPHPFTTSTILHPIANGTTGNNGYSWVASASNSHTDPTPAGWPADRAHRATAPTPGAPTAPVHAAGKPQGRTVARAEARGNMTPMIPRTKIPLGCGRRAHPTDTRPPEPIPASTTTDTPPERRSPPPVENHPRDGHPREPNSIHPVA